MDHLDQINQLPCTLEIALFILLIRSVSCIIFSRCIGNLLSTGMDIFSLDTTSDAVKASFERQRGNS